MMDEAGIALVALERSDRTVLVRLSNGEDLELAADSLPPALVVDGKPLDHEILQTLRDAAQRKQIARLVFRMLDRRLHTRRMALDKLTAKGFSKDLSLKVLDSFARQGLMSDRLFAEAWCRDTLRNKPVGRAYLKSGLMKKGIAPDLAEEVIRDNLDPESEQQGAEAAARKWWSRQSGAAGPREIAKGMRHLQSRGFPAAIAGRAIRANQPKDGMD
jgi:regulatory protein